MDASDVAEIEAQMERWYGPIPEPPRKRTTGRVYFVKDPDGPVKIGWASNVERRFSSLQTAHYRELRLIGSADGGRALERRLHTQLAKHRIRGEWFRPHPDVFEAIWDLTE